METDYKAKYEEALNKARELHGTVAAGRDFLAEIFPELAESEDKRIRKELIAFLRYYYYGQGDSRPFNEDWIFWLEKLPKEE